MHAENLFACPGSAHGSWASSRQWPPEHSRRLKQAFQSVGDGGGRHQFLTPFAYIIHFRFIGIDYILWLFIS